MFSGIVETTGKIKAIATRNKCKHFCIMPNKRFSDLHIGDSVSVNGVCLTITKLKNKSFYVTSVPETLRLTNLNYLQLNDEVNLERSIKTNSRIGGHFLQGHIDTKEKILSLSPTQVKISIKKSLAKYLVNKGYIGLDGMSITLIKATHTFFTITLIPHTREHTIAKNYRVGQWINIEVDILGKYIEKLLER